MYGYLRLILQSIPISIVEQKEFRGKKITDLLLALVRVVEKRISEEMDGTKGAIMYDRWTTSGTYYLGIIAVYTRAITFMNNGKLQKDEVVSMPLLSCSSIATILREDDEGQDIHSMSTRINAEAHIRQFEDIFHIFGVNVHK